MCSLAILGYFVPFILKTGRTRELQRSTIIPHLMGGLYVSKGWAFFRSRGE